LVTFGVQTGSWYASSCHLSAVGGAGTISFGWCSQTQWPPSLKMFRFAFFGCGRSISYGSCSTVLVLWWSSCWLRFITFSPRRKRRLWIQYEWRCYSSWESFETIPSRGPLGVAPCGMTSCVSWARGAGGKPDPLGEKLVPRRMGVSLTAQNDSASSDSIWALPRCFVWGWNRARWSESLDGMGQARARLLKILSRITAPTSGQVKNQGTDCGSLPGKVGTGFHPDLTGRENIYLKRGRFLGMDRAGNCKKVLTRLWRLRRWNSLLIHLLNAIPAGCMCGLAFAVAVAFGAWNSDYWWSARGWWRSISKKKCF